MDNLYTLVLNFSDHLVGLNQREAKSPEEAAQEFILKAECLEGYDRSMLLEKLNPLLHIAGNAGDSRRYKGLWILSFHTHDIPDLQWPGDNPVLGGYVIQTDQNGPTREPGPA